MSPFIKSVVSSLCWPFNAPTLIAAILIDVCCQCLYRCFCSRFRQRETGRGCRYGYDYACTCCCCCGSCYCWALLCRYRLYDSISLRQLVTFAGYANIYIFPFYSYGCDKGAFTSRFIGCHIDVLTPNLKSPPLRNLPSIFSVITKYHAFFKLHSQYFPANTSVLYVTTVLSTFTAVRACNSMNPLSAPFSKPFGAVASPRPLSITQCCSQSEIHFFFFLWWLH